MIDAWQRYGRQLLVVVLLALIATGLGLLNGTLSNQYNQVSSSLSMVSLSTNQTLSELSLHERNLQNTHTHVVAYLPSAPDIPTVLLSTVALAKSEGVAVNLFSFSDAGAGSSNVASSALMSGSLTSPAANTSGFISGMLKVASGQILRGASGAYPLSITLSVTGAPDRILSLIDRIEHESRVTHIQSFSLGFASTKILTTSISYDVYYEPK